jgi:glutaredoxin
MIELITRDGCVFCTRAKSLLQNAGMPYIEKKIGLDIDREEVLKTYPDAKLLPLFILDSEYKGSYDELFPWVNEMLSKDQIPKIEEAVNFSS